MNVAPGATFELSIEWGSTGATLGARILDNAGATTTARFTGFTEYPASSGVYYKTGVTAPSTAGQYTILYDDDGGTAAVGHTAVEELLVGQTVATITSGSLYVTTAQLKATLGITTTYADADIDIAVSAASRAVDGYKSDRFYPTTETRYYTGGIWDTSVDIDSLNTLTSVTIDTDGNATYETTWTSGTDFVLTPQNASTAGYPYRKLELLSQAGRRFPGYTNAIKVVGSFGWATCPAGVAQATGIMAGRLLKRARETPYGILVVSGDAVAAARLGRVDPDVAFLLDNLPGAVPLLAV